MITGATGFVGRAVADLATRSGWLVRAAVRSTPVAPHVGREVVGHLDLAATTDWHDAMEGVDAVIHCAARVHVLKETTNDPLAEFRRVNVEGTRRLAEQAASQGVRRFVFVSSIGVNGSETFEVPFRADDLPSPATAYARSKLEAEQVLLGLARSSTMEVTIIRPPLVFGPGAPGNFRMLLRAIRWGLPMPFGAVQNRRSMVAIDNLADLLLLCISHPGAANQTFLVSDGEDLSTPELLRRISAALKRPARLVPVPVAFLELAARALGQHAKFRQLCGSLQVDIEKTRALLGWAPPCAVDDALARIDVALA